ncbi:MAG: type II secretion system minor pseudopilin GspJ [Proteobacteria bacterium]|nr:type II secretion system minor pseudopilin GspJ [Pseudomonadota bacterium]MBU1686372.1 type II secretion system minor pseudopilin GspJ [Pseudomonadota bacterium]
MRCHEGASNGFTLLELLVALSIFAIMSVVAYSSLAAMAEIREQLRDEGKRLTEIQTAFRLIGRDIEQAIARPIRDGYGDPLPAMSLTEGEGVILEFTRSGWRNPTGRQRSTLQRITYRFLGEELIRESWPVLDRAVDSTPFSRTILTGVMNLEVSFIGQDRQISPAWPPESSADPAQAAKILPRAVRIFLDLEGWGRVDRLYLIGGAI